jgi:hypothetical protein
MTRHSLYINGDISSLCRSKYEAVLLAAIGNDPENAVVGQATDKELSDRTLGLILAREVPKYLGMLLKKGFVKAWLEIGNSDGTKAGRMRVDAMTETTFTISEQEYGFEESNSDCVGRSVGGENQEDWSIKSRTVEVDFIAVFTQLDIKKKKAALKSEIDALKQSIKEVH